MELSNTIADIRPMHQHVSQVAGDLATLWMVIATALVMFMQAGFLLLEAGSMRSKSTINVAQKNVTDLIIAGCVFLTFGSSLMFGAGNTGLFGFGGFSFSDNSYQPMLIYQFGFCAAAATIMSGAIGERTTFRAYMVLSLIVAAIVYPMFGRIVWGNALIRDNPSFMADLGFLDYAGGTVVHAIGGAAALAACFAIGPRSGRFDKSGKPRPMPGHSSVLSLLGVLILAVGWIGFNAGTAAPGSADFTNIVVNTVVAMCFGGAAGLLTDLYKNPRSMQPRTSASGILGGLVGVTAGCAYVDFFGAIFLGLGGGLIATVGADFLLKKCQLDDPVDAISTHLFAGAFGTVALALVIKPEFVVGSRFQFLGVQLLGVTIATIWAFLIIFLTIKTIQKFMAVRISLEEEKLGLNLAEHNLVLDTEQITSALAGAENRKVDELGREVVNELSGEHGEENIGLVTQLVEANCEAKRVLSEKQQQFDDYEKVGTDWLWETDADLRISYISKKFFKEFGPDAESIVGKPYISFLSEYQTPLAEHEEKLTREEVFDDEVFEVRGLDGKVRIFSNSGIPRYNREGQFTGYRGRSLDVSDRVRAEEEIRFLAHHDHLTGLANRPSFVDQTRDLMKNPDLSSNGIAVMSLDLDGFKAVNDNYGHQVGDELLKVVAARIENQLKNEFVLARFGGDEFVIALSLGAHGSSEIINTGQSIIQSLQLPVQINGLVINVGVSVGSARFPQDGQDLSSLIQYSDIALYEAKAGSKGVHVQFTLDMSEKLKRRQELENALLAGIEKGEFFVQYQPQFHLKDLRLSGFEALLRWQHPKFGNVSPGEFIPIAEDIGFISELGKFVLFEACKTATYWPRVHGEELKVSVNVSPKQFFNQQLTKDISEVLSNTGLSGRRLEIEITEGTLVKNAEEASDILKKIQGLEIQVAVDDFGTGYSSLSYLQKFPLDRLKVDRAFVRNLGKNDSDNRITKSIVSLGKTLGLQVGAEGVETATQLELLKQMGCDEIQGFILSKPTSALRVMKLIANSNSAYINNGLSEQNNEKQVFG